MSLPELDTSLFYLINRGLQNGFFDLLMPFVTDNAVLLFAPFVIWILVKDRNRAWTFLAVSLAAVALADGSGNIIKDLVGRQRPCQALSDINLLAGCGSHYSLPSNHASNAFAFAAAFLFLRRGLIAGFFIFIASAVAFSRVYVGVHYPLDVVAGGALGVLSAYCALLFYRHASEAYEEMSYKKALFLILLLTSLFRVYYILAGPFDLSADEAHYWEWSRRLDWSYYSKGPMIAWLIHAGTAVFGDTVFGVRILAVLLYAASSFVLYKLGKELYDERTGFMSAALIQIVPLYSVFGIIFTIDSPFIFFWTASLYLFWKAINTDKLLQSRHSREARSRCIKQRNPGGHQYLKSMDSRLRTSGMTALKRTFYGVGDNALTYWLLLGITVGLGLLTKYTMAFFYVCAFLYMVTQWMKKGFRTSELLCFCTSALVSLLVFSPVIIWNAVHGWVTVRHTAGQAHVADGLQLSARDFFEFLGSQFGVITPVLFVLIFIALWRLRKEKEGAFLFWFLVPVVAFFMLKSVQGKVQANWALPGYATGFIAFSAYYLRDFGSMKKKGKGLVVAGLILASALTFVSHAPYVLHLPPKKDPSTKLAGWKELGNEVGKIYTEMSSAGPVFIFSDKYQVSSELAFYVRGNPVTYCINLGRRMNQYDLWPGLERLAGHNAVFVRTGESVMPSALAGAFSRCEREVLNLRTKKKRVMKFTVFKCYDFRAIEAKPPESF